MQETGDCNARINLQGYHCTYVGGGKNRGVAIYVKNAMANSMTKEPASIINDLYQCLKLQFPSYDFITIYRACGPVSQKFVDDIRKGIDPKKPTIICGDFNFDRRMENNLTRTLANLRFKQIVQDPTHILGGCIDHVYHNISTAAQKVDQKLHYPYYSDHEAVCLMIVNT